MKLEYSIKLGFLGFYNSNIGFLLTSVLINVIVQSGIKFILVNSWIQVHSKSIVINKYFFIY